MITSQINGDFECRNERVKKYLEEVKGRIVGLEVKFVQIPREENECADRLAKAAFAEFMNTPKQVLSFVQTCSLIDDGRKIQEIDVEEDWTAPLKEYLQSGSLPDGKDRIGSHHGIGRAHTTSRPWTEESFSIHGIRSTFGNTTSRSDV